jgi:hypothetical protein
MVFNLYPMWMFCVGTVGSCNNLISIPENVMNLLKYRSRCCKGLLMLLPAVEPKVWLRFQKICTFMCILSQMNLFYTLDPYFLENHFNSIFLYIYMLSKWLFDIICSLCLLISIMFNKFFVTKMVLAYTYVFILIMNMKAEFLCRPQFSSDAHIWII